MALKYVSRRLIVHTLIATVTASTFFGITMSASATEEEDPAEQSATADTTLEDNSAGETTPADTDEDGLRQEQAKLLDSCFGEVVMYRWDRVYKDDYPKDTEWHLSMLIWNRDDGKIDDGYIGALAPDDIWMGPEANPVEGVTHSFTNDDPIYKRDFKDNKHILEKETYYIRLTDRAEGLDIGSDPQVQPNRNTFFTDDDRDCIYVKYGKRDKDNEGEDDSKAPVYAIKLSRSANATRDYILEPWGRESNSSISIHDNEYGYEWTFQSDKRDNCGLVWQVFYNKDNEDDPNFAVGAGRRFLTARSDYDKYAYYKWFIGTKLRFSSIDGNVTVGGGQILSISPSNYVDTAGEGQSQQGVILPGGQTITIEKGGILSISGDFINNGTIINNGGTIIIQKGGTLYPFLQGDDMNTLGCGSIKCNSGDIIVEEGGALYTGMNCALGSGNVRRNAAFWMDNSSTLVNYGLVATGKMELGNAATVENRGEGRMYSCLWEPSWSTFVDQLSDNNSKLMSGATEGLLDLGYFKLEDGDNYGGIGIINGPKKLSSVPAVYVTKGKDGYLNNPSKDWQNQYLSQGLIHFGIIEL